MGDWDAGQYLRFAAPRLRPALDLLARAEAALARPPATVFDLGCGTGAVAGLALARWPGAAVTGVDGSPSMLDRARASDLAATWVEADLAAWRPTVPADLVISNAALHWLDHHDRLFRRLIQTLAPGGVLAVQMPRNFEAPSHALLDALAREEPWRRRLEPLLRRTPVSTPEHYGRLLAPAAQSLDIWETTYLQILAGDAPVLEWMKGTLLRPLIDALEADERATFLDAYAGRLAEAYPRGADGTTLFPFRRLFIVARRR